VTYFIVTPDTLGRFDGTASSFTIEDGAWQEGSGSGGRGYESLTVWFRGSGFSFDSVNGCGTTSRPSRGRPVVTVQDGPPQR
jgi:hypothetical protein